MEGLILVVLIFIAFAITHPFTSLVHELGHAICALILTNEEVSVYVGSHGDSVNSITFRIGRLKCFFKFNILKWTHGLCLHGQTKSRVDRTLILLMGSLSSLLCAIIFYYLIFSTHMHGALKLILFIYGFSALYDLLINLIPSSTPIFLHNGSVVYNDGYALVKLWTKRKNNSINALAIREYKLQNYTKAAELFEKVVNEGNRTEVILRLTISSLMQAKEFSKAKDQILTLKSYFDLNSEDFSNLGITYLFEYDFEEAVRYFDRSLEIDSENIYCLNNRGYSKIFVKDYNGAIADLNHAIKLDSEFANPYNARGFVKIKMGQVEDGLADINHSLKLDNRNSYAYLNLGIYEFERCNYQWAMDYFEQAVQIDTKTLFVDKYIDMTNAHLQAKRKALD